MDLAFLITTSLVRLLAHSVLKIKWSIAEFLENFTSCSFFQAPKAQTSALLL